MRTPVVLVHGLWHGSWCWTPVVEQLAARGVPAVAVDLDGHGLKHRSPEARWARPFDRGAYAAEPAPLADVTAASAAETLVGQLRRIGGGRPCLVVAHSMGGVVATAATERAPDLVAGLVYVSAFAPVSGPPAGYYLGEPENAGERVTPLMAADPALVGALRQDTGGRAGRDAVRDAFYHDVDRPTAEAAISLLSPDGPLGIAQDPVPVTAARYGSVPHTYVVCTRDRVVPEALQRRFVTEIDAVSAQPTRVFELDTSHSPFLSRPADLAEVIAAVALRSPSPPRPSRSRTAPA
ncbi:alpha/beta fold hydrolase [Jidongwangia harbinensis]|uniref:alpha/beta fold hydrolase n=1 Tax=Jidongwangia harbinensis TaxID=2878561 RepID=UPI001CDA4808|nr:alpha/beta fold hydrolase [Jidongwangia harbinensis]MCA2214160.1 alpha/beta hydrolase [Jidongwangia harbinensis]